jgi:hypothetical protein
MKLGVQPSLCNKEYEQFVNSELLVAIRFSLISQEELLTSG